ncbi:ankyrin repeat family protein [Rhynchospora pubera]|uniref:Ankyrin repeat family protein n=1 Tax=Rhynchospora pubera TaxID=906938 RepID=A0AAV8GF20_9POAL|nr:ankyrin repeat family protein [Rhynchospora pubera]
MLSLAFALDLPSYQVSDQVRDCKTSSKPLDIVIGLDGGNALHVAVNRGKISSLKCLLKYILPEEIINHQDYDGNTPLHLAAKQSKIQSSLLLLKDRRANPCLLNNKGQTARSSIEMLRETSTYEIFIWRELRKQEAKRCKKEQLPPVGSTNRKTSDDYFELSVQTYALVAALIATVTFTAFFTMPGGYDQQRGFAILGREPGFKPFVISNTIAMCSAFVVLLCLIWSWHDPVMFKLTHLKWSRRLTVLACLSMIVSLMTAVYLVVEPESRWLSIAVILIGCSTPIVVCLILGVIPVGVSFIGFF